MPLDLSGMDQLMNPTYVIARVSDGRSNINSGAFTRAGGTEEEGNITVNTNEDNIRVSLNHISVSLSDASINIWVNLNYISISLSDASINLNRALVLVLMFVSISLNNV